MKFLWFFLTLSSKFILTWFNTSIYLVYLLFNSSYLFNFNLKKLSFFYIGSDREGPLKDLVTDYTKNQQPALYEPNYSSDNIIWLSISFSVIVIIYIIIYWNSLKLRTLLSVYDVFKHAHIEFKVDELDNDDQEKIKNVSSSFGAFFTGFTVIFIIFLISYYLMLFIENNIEETQSLVPVASLLHQETFKNIKFTLTFVSYSYRGLCLKENVMASCNTNNTEVINKEASFDEKTSKCELLLKLNSKTVINNGELITINFQDFNSYASEFSIILNADSSIPGKKSIVGQHIIADPGKVFRGYTPTVFLFSLIPSYYKSTSLFTSIVKKGYHAFATTDPIIGSQYDIENIPMSRDLNIQIMFELESSGITTYRYETQDILPFIGNLAGSISGIFGGIGIMIWLFEFIYLKRKGKKESRSGQYEAELEKKITQRLSMIEDKKNKKASLIASRINEGKIN